MNNKHIESTGSDEPSSLTGELNEAAAVTLDESTLPIEAGSITDATVSNAAESASGIVAESSVRNLAESPVQNNSGINTSMESSDDPKHPIEMTQINMPATPSTATKEAEWIMNAPSNLLLRSILDGDNINTTRLTSAMHNISPTGGENVVPQGENHVQKGGEDAIIQGGVGRTKNESEAAALLQQQQQPPQQDMEPPQDMEEDSIVSWEIHHLVQKGMR